MGLEFGVKVGNLARDNNLCACVVKPHGVTDKPLGEAILHGSGGRRMIADILRFDEGSSGGFFEDFSQTRAFEWLSCHVRPDVSLTSADVRPQVI